jgi:hypothetical protein
MSLCAAALLVQGIGAFFLRKLRLLYAEQRARVAD